MSQSLSTTAAATAHHRFRVSYTFTDRTSGDKEAIREALRSLSFSDAFDPEDITDWRVSRTEDGQYLLAAQCTVMEEIVETSERHALRRFLYGMDLPGEIDVANIRIERLEPVPQLSLVEA